MVDVSIVVYYGGAYTSETHLNISMIPHHFYI